LADAVEIISICVFNARFEKMGVILPTAEINRNSDNSDAARLKSEPR